MKNFRVVLALLALLIAPAAALAQGQTQIHSVPIGRGGGSSGFGAAVPNTAGQPLVSNGVAADPSFGTIGNSGFTPGAADTYKGSLNGTTTVDVPQPSCTAVNQALRYTPGSGPVCGAIIVQTGYDMPVNLGLSASAAGGALTINLTQASGAAPTSANPVLVPFRSTNATLGTVVWRTINAGLSLTIPSGATLGTSSGNVPIRVWLFVHDNTGTPELAVATCSNASVLYACSSWEHTLKNTLVLNASSSAAGSLYAPTVVSLDAVRIIGFCDLGTGVTTAGVWTACTTLQAMGPGVKKPGDVVQTAASISTAQVTATSTTKVQANPSITFVLSSSPNLVRVTVYNGLMTNANTSAQGYGQAQISRTTTFTGVGNTINIGTQGASESHGGSPISLYALDSPGAAALSGVTYVPFIWCSQACGTNGAVWNDVGGSSPGVPSSSIEAQEIMGALEPANDNGLPLAMAG